MGKAVGRGDIRVPGRERLLQVKAGQAVVAIGGWERRCRGAAVGWWKREVNGRRCAAETVHLIHSSRCDIRRGRGEEAARRRRYHLARLRRRSYGTRHHLWRS